VDFQVLAAPMKSFCVIPRGAHGHFGYICPITAAIALVYAVLNKAYCSLSQTKLPTIVFTAPSGLGMVVGAVVINNLFPSKRQKRI
jgi:hypothetical protein